MPCWYFDKKEIKHNPSHQQGIDSNNEARYRREGARLILDAGNKLGLRYDTCATGVVYFHRFYMFHSFKEFHRYVTAACCLFLAGKVEETPKKCKDIIRTCHGLLSPQSFAVFGDNPREEVMTMERILLQTIKFDLQVEHPHTFLLRYAKLLKGDKEKTQKIVQMAWTFINDSLCTTLCLQWEPEIVAVSLMYLASRLQKYEVVDWQGRIPNSDLKWWEFIIEDLSMPLMEDVCHQVLDLYSQQSKDAARQQGDSPPPSPPKTGPPTTPSQPPSSRKSVTSPADPKKMRKELPEKKSVNGSQKTAPPPAATVTSTAAAPGGLTAYNPYVDLSMQGSSFMNQSGGQNIQPLISGAPPPAAGYPPYSQAPPTSAAQYPPGYPPQAGYPPPTTYTAPPTTSAPPPPYTAPYAPPNYPPPAGYPPTTTSSQPYPPGFPPGYPGYGSQPPPAGTAFPPGPPGAPRGPFPPARYAAPPPGGPRGPRPGIPGPRPAPPGGQGGNKNTSMMSGLAAVRITGR